MTQTNQISKQERIPGLDGLRAIAILLIVLGHLSQQAFWYGNCPLPSLPLPGGALSIFFVLSGFLAGYYPAKTFDSKSYYIRRAKKLFPAYYSYICIVIITYLLLGRSHEVLNSRLFYYIVPAGIVPFCHSEGILPLVHLWFITPIVIFYISLPLLLKRVYGGVKLAVEATLIICISFAVLKWGLYIFAGKETFAYRFFNASQFDCIFGGLCLGLFLRNKEHTIPKILSCKATNIMLWMLFLTSGLYVNFIPSPCRSEFFGLLTAGLIVGFIYDSSILKFKAPVWRKLSNASYYIYVYHILAIILFSELFRLFI